MPSAVCRLRTVYFVRVSDGAILIALRYVGEGVEPVPVLVELPHGR